MKLYNKKYLFIGILASLVTACGGGGGGGGNSTSTPSSTTNSKTNTNISAPTKLHVGPEPNKHGDDYSHNLPSSNNAGVLYDKPGELPPPFEKPPSKNNTVLNIKENMKTSLVAIDNETAINEKSGAINVNTTHSAAILSVGKTSKGINEGTITGTHSDPEEKMTLMEGVNGANLENRGIVKGTGISITAISNRSDHGEGFTSINDGNIELHGSSEQNLYYTDLIGMEAIKNIEKDKVDGNTTLINNKNISINNINFHLLNPNAVPYIRGMSMAVYGKSTAKNTMINNGNINITGKGSIGMSANGNNITVLNKGTIKASGKNSYGIFGDGENIEAINEGTIEVDGEYSTGIGVYRGATGINEKTGIIKIDGQNSFAMSAINGSKIINRGKIILNGNSTGMYAGSLGSKADDYAPSSIINEGEIIFKDSNDYKIAIWATGNSTYINKGKIIGDDSIEIKTEGSGQFIVGKEASGEVAKVKAKKSLKIDGEVKASKDLIVGNSKKIVYSDVFSAPKIELARAINPKAVSMFYDSKLEINNQNNVDIAVYRNDTTIEKNYKSKEFGSLVSSLDNYLNIEKTKFSKDEKLVVDKILKSDNINSVRKVVKDLSGQVYANLPRQIFDIQTRFVKEDEKLIDNLNEHSYNFNFFGDKSSVKDKGEISGYKTISEGFVGTKRFTDDVFTTIGYQNSHVKYNDNSKGSIQSIHTGVYKKFLLNNFNIKLGLNGEYNFHETNREIDTFNKKAKAKYNSYTFGANGEISKLYGDSMYFKPMAGLNLGYGKYKKFTEKNVGDLGVTLNAEDYFSILPSVGFKVGKNFDFIDLYSNIVYSYELGELNKKQGMSLLGDKVSYKLKNDSLKKENLVLNVGLTTEIKDFKVSFEIGKEFGKRDNNYLSLGVGYKF